MPTPAAWLCAIRARPESDQIRLEFADALQGGDDPEVPADHARAELVRLQIELARLPACDRQDEPRDCIPFELAAKCFPCQRAWPLRWREEALLGEYEARWFPHARTRRQVAAKQRSVVGCCNRHADNMACDCMAAAWGVYWRRGFIESVTLSWADCRDHLDAVLAAHPVREVEITSDVPTERRPVVNGMSQRLAGGQWVTEHQMRVIGRKLWPGRGEGDVRLILLAARWPSVAFTLPPVQGSGPYYFPQALADDEREAMANYLMDRHGIPRAAGVDAPADVLCALRRREVPR